MEIEKTADKYNSLLKRREISFSVNHIASGTPKLYDIRKELAAMYGATEDSVYVTEMNTPTGTNQARGEGVVYDSPERAKQLVPEYIRVRNATSRNEKKGEKPAKKEKGTKKKAK